MKKRFTGPVKRFNWVKLFENKVPEDKLGYLLAGTAYINYIPIFESQSRDYEPAVIEKEHKQYLVPIPIMFSAEREYKDKSYEGVMQSKSGCLFGTSAKAPMALMTYTNNFLKTQVSQRYYYKKIKDGRKWLVRSVGAHTFYSGSNLLDSLQISNQGWCGNKSDTAESLFKNIKVRIGGKLHSNFYFLNKDFVKRNLFINEPFYKHEAKNKNIREAAMHLTYKDDSALHKINRTISDARSALAELSSSCSPRAIKRLKKYSRVLRNYRSSYRYEAYSRRYYNFANIRQRLNYYQNDIANASTRFEKLVAKPGGIQASTNSLEHYNAEVSMVPMSMNNAKVLCGKFGSAVSALSTGPSKKTQSFMTLFGSVLQDSYNKSSSTSGGSGIYLTPEKYPRQYKPSSTTTSGKIDSVNIPQGPRLKPICYAVRGADCPGDNWHKPTNKKTPISGGDAR